MSVDLTNQLDIQLMRQREDAVKAIMESARLDLIRSAARRMYRAQVESGKIEYADLKIAVDLIGAEHFKSEKRGRKSQTLMKFVTISAKDNIDVHQFWKQMEKCIKKSKLRYKRCSYVLEQRSEGDQEPYGWHIHWLVEFEATSSAAIISQQVYQCFTKYLGGANYVDVKDVYDEEQYQQKMKYITGSKKEDKMGKVKKDVELRNKKQIPHIITY